MSEDESTSTVVNFVIGFIVGSLIGAIVALLFAPQSGEASRNLIKEKSLELKDRATETSGEWVRLTQERASELQKRGIKLVEEQYEGSSQPSTDSFDENLP